MRLLSVIFLLVSVWSCGTKEYVPKPTGYNRIDLPAVAYQPLAEKHPYFFEHSKHSYIRPDSASIAEPHWIYIIYPKFKANVQLTYKSVKQDPKFFANFVDDSHKLLSKHFIKATSVEDSKIKTPSGKTAMIFELEGEVPSQFQFYVTDSTKHFLRGALYFRTATKNDSLKPIIDFIKKDVIHLLNTVKWDYEQ
jgi:gliding motility-associated lipoprotein GldD